MIDVEEESGYFEGGEVASRAYGLSGDVLNSLASVESDNFVLSLVQGFDQTFDGYRV